MKMIVAVVLALVAVSHAASLEPIPIVRSDFSQQPDGPYEFAFETGNGIVRSENGQLKEALDEDGKPHSVVVVRGSYGYTDPEGNSQTINFFADESGFHPEGDSIPKPVSRR